MRFTFTLVAACLIAACSRGPRGTDGTDGADGRDGTSGTIVEVIDPCGDGPGPDEILIVLDTGVVLAWYQHLGLTQLVAGTLYMTTDEQGCLFSVDSEGNVDEG